MLALSLVACDVFTTPIKREYTKQTVTITWQEVDTESQLNAACRNSEPDKRILGCAYMFEPTATCTIFTYRNGPLETLGHEMLHCFAGRWHS